MKLTKPSFEIISDFNRTSALKLIELAGRTCYKSEGKITQTSASPFVEKIIGFGHMSVIEHYAVTVKIICDRGVSHEIVRHRIASYSQESTRYCNYGKNEHVEFIIPPWCEVQTGNYEIVWSKKIGICSSEPEMNNTDSRWFWHMALAERDYTRILDEGWSPQQARSVLPNSLKTEIVMTANLREWKEVFRQRTSVKAHPQMQELMIPLRDEFHLIMPEIF